MVGHNGFIAGGCFKNIFLGQKVKDLDIFFRSEEEFERAVSYYKNHKDFSFVYKNDKCISYTDGKIRIELIKSIFGTPQEIISNFDFTIVKFVFYKHYDDDYDDYRYYTSYHKDFFEHMHFKRLVIDDKIPFPVSTFERTYRYAGYGFLPCRETRKRIVESLQGIDVEEDFDLSMYIASGWD